MSRRLECRSCLQKKKMFTKDEIRAGWRARAVAVAVDRTDRPVNCDTCNDDIHGTVAFALSEWQGESKYILPWEHEMGSVLTDDQLRLSDKLGGVHPMVTEDIIWCLNRQRNPKDFYPV